MADSIARTVGKSQICADGMQIYSVYADGYAKCESSRAQTRAQSGTCVILQLWGGQAWAAHHDIVAAKLDLAALAVFDAASGHLFDSEDADRLGLQNGGPTCPLKT